MVGATALLLHVRTGRSRHASRWLIDLLQRKKPKLVAVALANKIARVAWKLMVSGETIGGQRDKHRQYRRLAITASPINATVLS
ncbi:hypothetical protein AJ87_49110 [Rhizobium yanglingense]|nr:hypothetical protein AJ87_49110 [Rhizobium yanglingense]